MTFTFKLAKRLSHSRFVSPRLLAAVVLLAGCADAAGVGPTSSTFDSVSAAPKITSVIVSPGTAGGAVGQSAQFSAVAKDAAGRTYSGLAVTWSSSNTAVVTVTSGGLATAIGGGSASVNATISGVTGRATVTVTGATITVANVAVTPGTASGNVGDAAQFTAAVTDAAGTAITSVPVVWSTSNAAVITVSATGYVTAVGGGSADVIATAGGKSGKATVTVAGAPASAVGSVIVTPGAASGSAGQSAQFSAAVKDANGADLAGQTVTWSSTNPAVVTVTATGYATAVGSGSAAIVATAGGKSGQAAITVTGGTTQPGPVATISLSPSTATIGIGALQPLTATLRDAAGTVLTGRTISWTTSAPLVGSVSTLGVVTGLVAGSTTITATSEGVSSNAVITVSSSVVPPQPPPSGSEPTFQAGQRLIWRDTFDGGLSDAAVLTNYITLNPQYIHADAAAGLNGGGALRFDWQASTGCQDQSRLIEQGIEPTREIYVTYTIRYTPNFQFDWRNYSGCTGNAKKLFFLYSVSGSRFDFISENHFLGMGSDYDHPLFAQNQNGTMSVEQLGDGSWHRITIHVVQSSTPTATDGVIEGWIDGVQKWSYRNVASNASGGWNYFHFPSTFNQGSPATQSEWIDDLVVWKP